MPNWLAYVSSKGLRLPSVSSMQVGTLGPAVSIASGAMRGSKYPENKGRENDYGSMACVAPGSDPSAAILSVSRILSTGRPSLAPKFGW